MFKKSLTSSSTCNQMVLVKCQNLQVPEYDY